MDRWEYRIVNLGSFQAAVRMVAAFGHLGSEGWELVALYDKGSNWLAGMEKGFAVFKRLVPDGIEHEGPWARWDYADHVGGPDLSGLGHTPSERAGTSSTTAASSGGAPAIATERPEFSQRGGETGGEHLAGGGELWCVSGTLNPAGP